MDEINDCVCLALFGEFEMLQQYQFTDVKEKQETVLAAIFMGHLDIVKWVVFNYCQQSLSFPWPKKTSLYAAKYGYPEILSYAIGNGAPIHQQQCMYEAAKYNHYDCLNILLESSPKNCIGKDLLSIWDDLSAEVQDRLIVSPLS